MASGRSATYSWHQFGICATCARRWPWMSAGLFGQILALVASTAQEVVYGVAWGS
jgi:hypothetical protein